MALTLTASTVVASVKPTVSSNRRYVDVVCARISRRWFALFFLDESGKMWAIRARFLMVFLYVRLWKPTDGRSLLSIYLSICAASNKNDAFVWNACPELVRVHRFRRPRAFVNFVIFWIIHKMIRWYLSLFMRKLTLTLFLSSVTPAKQQILQGRVVLQDRRFCPDCLVRFLCVFFILLYPFVRSFVVRETQPKDQSLSNKVPERRRG